MLPTSTLLCGLLALCVGLTHASIASAFESTPSTSYGNDHGGGDFHLFVSFSHSHSFLAPPCPTFDVYLARDTSPIAVAYVRPRRRFALSVHRGRGRRVGSRRDAVDPQVLRAPAARRNCYGDFIDRVRACAPSLRCTIRRVERCTAPTRSICHRRRRGTGEKRKAAVKFYCLLPLSATLFLFLSFSTNRLGNARKTEMRNLEKCGGGC